MDLHEDDYALVVGVNHYVSDGGGFKPLTSAINDAEEVRRWLLDKKEGGRLPDENCRFVQSVEKTGKPVQLEIDEKIDEIFKLVKGKKKSARRLYFYFSGHGMASGSLQAFLCLPRWSNSWRCMALDSEAYWSSLMDSGRFREIICLFDCCRSYRPNIGGLPPSVGGGQPDEQAAKAELFLGFAAEFQQPAFENPDDHGFFTRALLSGLRGGACNPTGGAPASRLKHFLESETIRLAEAAGKKQTPKVHNGFSSVVDPVFGSALPLGAPPQPGSAVKKLPYEINVLNAPNRTIVLVHPDNTELPWDGSPNPWRLSLGEGLHLLEDKENGRVVRLTRDATQGVIHVDF
jgi:hypothetical protein